MKAQLFCALLMLMFISSKMPAIGYYQIDAFQQPKVDMNEVSAVIDSMWLYRITDPHKGIQLGINGLQLIDSTLGDCHTKTKLLSFLGVCYRYAGFFNEAFKCFEAQLDGAFKQKDSLQIGYSFINLSGLFVDWSNKAMALKYSLNANELFLRIGDKAGIGYSFFNLGEINQSLHNYQEAIKYYEKSLLIRLEGKDICGAANALLGMGQVYMADGNKKKCIDLFRKALNYFQLSKNSIGIAQVHECLAVLDLESGNIINARRNINISTNINKNNNKFGYCKDLIILSKIHNNHGDFQKSEETAKEALNLAQKYGYTEYEMQCYDLLTDIEINLQKYKAAVHYFKLLSTSYEKKSDLNNINELIKIREEYIELKYISEKNRITNELANSKLSNYFLVSLTSFFLVIFLLGFIKKRSDKKVHQLSKDLFLTREKMFRLIAHDLRNPLNSVSSLAELMNKDFYLLTEEERYSITNIISESSNSMSLLVENLFEWANSQLSEGVRENTVFDLSVISDRVCGIYKTTSLQKGIDIINNIEKGIEVYFNQDIFELTIRNLLSNALKFSVRASSIDIKALVFDGRVKIIIENVGKPVFANSKKTGDNYQKFELNTGTNNERSNGLGLMMINEFLDKADCKLNYRRLKDQNKNSFSFIIPLRSYNNKMYNVDKIDSNKGNIEPGSVSSSQKINFNSSLSS